MRVSSHFNALYFDTRMNPLLNSPTPLFDNLQYLNSSFKEADLIYARHGKLSPPKDSKEDLYHCLTFLHSYNGSQATFNSYRREVERLVQWAWYIQEKTLPELRRLDIEEYLEFCQQPPLAWIGIKQVARFRVIDDLRVKSLTNLTNKLNLNC